MHCNLISIEVQIIDINILHLYSFNENLELMFIKFIMLVCTSFFLVHIVWLLKYLLSLLLCKAFFCRGMSLSIVIGFINTRANYFLPSVCLLIHWFHTSHSGVCPVVHWSSCLPTPFAHIDPPTWRQDKPSKISLGSSFHTYLLPLLALEVSSQCFVVEIGPKMAKWVWSNSLALQYVVSNSSLSAINKCVSQKPLMQ